MRTKRKHERLARQEVAVAPQRPKRAPVDDWADGEDMPEGLGGIDADYDRPEDAVPPELRAQWAPSRFDGE